MIYFVGLLLMVLVCADLHRRRAAPFVIYAAATAMLLFIGVIIIAISRSHPQFVWEFQAERSAAEIAGGPLPGSTYTVFIAPLAELLLILSIPIGVVAVLWAQQRISAMYYPAFTRWLFWPILGGAVLVPGAVTLLLINRLWSPADPGFAVTVSDIAGWIAFGAFAVLFATSLWCFFRNIRARG